MNVNLRIMINAFFKCILFGEYHTWFIFTLLGLYAVTPFLYLIVQKKEYIYYFLILSVIFTIILPIIPALSGYDTRLISVLDSINMHLVVGYSLYFITGYFIAYMDHRVEKYAELVFLISAGIAFALSISMSANAGQANQEAYALFSPCGFLMNTSLMIIFKKYIGEERKSGFLHKMAALQKYGIAIYLMHVIFVDILTKGANMIYLATAVFIWMLCLGISMIMYRIPIINRVLFIRIGKKTYT